MIRPSIDELLRLIEEIRERVFGEWGYDARYAEALDIAAESIENQPKYDALASAVEMYLVHSTRIQLSMVVDALAAIPKAK